jgi:hypothetical protein
MPTTLRLFEIEFDADGHPNGSINEYHVGKIRQGDNMINKLSVTFATAIQPQQVQLHARRPDGAITPDTELLLFTNNSGTWTYDLSNWFTEFNGQIVMNLSVTFPSYTSGGTTIVPKLFTGTFILFVEGATISEGNIVIYGDLSLLDILEANYYDKTESDNRFFKRLQDDFFTMKTNTTVDINDAAAGTFLYNPNAHTFSYKDDFGEVINISQTLGGIGKNSDINIVEGTCVTISGSQGSHKLFIRADASDKAKSLIVGVVVKNVNQNEFAFVSVFGDIKIDNFTNIMQSGITTGLQAGSKLYLSATQPGKYTLTAPVRPNSVLWVATVTDYNDSNKKGSMFVFPHRESGLEGGTTIAVSSTQPSPFVDGDLWFQLLN